MEKQPIIAVKNLSVEYAKTLVFRKINFEILAGDFICLVGCNGAGKTTLIKTILGLIEPSAGSVEFLGMSRKEIGYISQETVITSNFPATVEEIVLSGLLNQKRGIFYTKSDKEKCEEALAKFGMKKMLKKHFAELSGGQRQKIWLARAVVATKKLLILDEPGNNLDSKSKKELYAELLKLNAQGITVVMITHDLGVVADFADRIQVMYAGEIMETGTVEEIFNDAHHPYTWALLSSMPQLGIKGQDLYAITGTPPSLFEQVVGDAFAPRNPYAMKIDFEEEPPMFAVSNTHLAKTWLLDPRAPKVEKPEVIRDLHERLLKTLGEGGTYHG